MTASGRAAPVPAPAPPARAFTLWFLFCAGVGLGCSSASRGASPARARASAPARDASGVRKPEDASAKTLVGADASRPASAKSDSAVARVDATAASAADAAAMSDADLASARAPDAARDAGAAAEPQPIAAPPSYLGTTDDGAACDTRYPTLGFQPADAAGVRHPLFLYFVGTAFVAGDAFASYDSSAAQSVARAMARRGFVALSVGYDNGAAAWLSDHKNQLDCLFGAAHATSLLAAACALPEVDCDAGIATWGHSQGAYIAVASASYEPRVRAAWATGYGGDAPAGLAKERLRVVNGEADTSNGTVAVLNHAALFDANECPDDGRDQCLRADGSGWIIVRARDCQSSSADHCWFDRRSCLDSAITLEPNWIDPSSTKAFALESNADWLAQTARRR